MEEKLYRVIYWYIYTHLKKFEYREKVIFFVTYLKKVKLSYILDSLHVK